MKPKLQATVSNGSPNTLRLEIGDFSQIPGRRYGNTIPAASTIAQAPSAIMTNMTSVAKYVVNTNSTRNRIVIAVATAIATTGLWKRSLTRPSGAGATRSNAHAI